MLAVLVARDVALAIPPYTSLAYTYIWGWTFPLVLGAQIWAGFENLQCIGRLYPKIGNFAKRLFIVCFVITVIGCCTGLPFELHRIGGQEALLRALFLVQRWVDCWIAGTLILVALFFARFPAPLKKPPRNLVVHTVLLSLYFTTYGLLYFVENLAPLGAVETAEQAQLSAIVMLYAVWATLLSSDGQKSEAWPEISVIVLETVSLEK